MTTDLDDRFAATGSRVAYCATICWIALGVESIVRPQQQNYRALLWMIPFSLTAVTFLFVHAVQRSQSGWAERSGFYAAITASALVSLGNVGLLIDQPIMAAFSFPWGALLWALGLVAFGIGTWRAGVLPRYVGLALALLEPGSLATGLALSPIAPLHDRGAYSAGVEKGLALMVVASGLRSRLQRSRS